MTVSLNSMIWRGLRAGTALSVLALAVPSAYAQEVTGTIRGDVVDDAGAPLSGATVTITHVPSGTRSVQTTDQSGTFSAPNLRIGGPFDITVAAPGFESAQSTIPTIAAGQPQRVSVFLIPEAQSIEVTATRATKSSIAIATGPATSLDARDIAGIASINRDVRNLAARDPFVSLDPTNGGAISIAGQNNRFNRFSVDGIAFGDPFGLESGGLASSRGAVPLDAIAEFTVEVAPVDIQQGGFQGGAINAVLKSGGNDFNIQGFFSYTSDSLAGDKTRGITVERDFESKIYGAQVTGPIIKDKLFFAVTWEQLRDKTPSLTGPTGEGFANQLPITRAQIDRTSDIADSVYGYDTLDVATSVPENDDKLVAKIDWNIADGHRAAFTYIYNKGNILAGQTGANQVTATNPTLALQSNNYDQGSINHYGVFQLNSEWTEGFSTQARVSYNDYERLQVPFNGRDFGQFRVCQAEVNAGQSGADLSRCPGGIGQIQFGPDISRQANELFVKTLGIELQARIQGGGHDVKLIAERRGQDIDNLFAQRVSGDWYFDTVPDLQNRRASFLDYASPILGDVDTTRAKFENNVFTFGVQDTWDVNDDLTLIYGVRYDLYQTGDRPVFNPDFVARTGFVNNSTLNGRDVIQPRFGLNWRVDDRLRLRASAGLYAGGSPNVWISNSYSNPGPLLGRVQVTRTGTGNTYTIAGISGLSAADQNSIGGQTLNNVDRDAGVPDILDQLIAQSGSSVAPTNALDPDFEIPSQWRLSGTVDYNANLGPLGDDWRLSASVVWSRVKSGLTWTDLRSIPNTVQAALPDGRPRYQGFNTASGTNTDIFLTNTDRGYSWNVVGQVDKTWENGISIGAAYTLQRAKDVNPGTSSVAFSNYDNTATDDPNGSAYGTSNYQIDDAWRLKFGYDTELFGDNTTRFELFLNSRAGQRYSHTFADAGTATRSNVFGTTGNDGRHLIYVPNVSSATADPLVQYAAGFDFAAFQSFIQDSGLGEYQGSIAPKNLGKSPRFTKLDLRISQEIPFFFGGKVEAFADVENILNLINSDWSSLRQVAFPYRAQIVNVTCTGTTALNTPCNKYVYSGFRAPSETIFTNQSLWQVRFGVRLAFRGL